MKTRRVLVTCPPMLGMLEAFLEPARDLGIELAPAKVTQILSEDVLIDLIPKFDGWIIGDDPASRRVFEAGKYGSLKAAVKWGVGVDNVDLRACDDLGIPFVNTPGMFGGEVADIAVGYLISLARHTFEIDRGIRQGGWPKPCGISLSGRSVAVVGYGDIGRNTARRLLAADMSIIVYDPFVDPITVDVGVSLENWPDRIGEVDFIVINCSLSSSSYHMIDRSVFALMKSGVRIVNVGRGPVIDETALISALDSGQVHSAALDVFEVEPLPLDSPLRSHPACIFGSHNSSNTVDAVERTSLKALQLISCFLNESSI